MAYEPAQTKFSSAALVVLPESGLAISSMLADILGVRVGDFVKVDLLEGQRRTVSLPVTALVENYLGSRE
jgi:putative ABC transport system permease protein